MARYSEFKYGGAKYGATTKPRNLTFSLEIDWDDDGLFDGVNEAVNLVDMNIRRGREFILQSAGQGFQNRFAGNLRVTLKDLDRRYDPFNVDGELHDLLEMNQRVRMRVKDEETGTVYPLFFGRIDDIRQNYAEINTVTLYASDGIKLLSETNVSSSVIYSTKQYDDAINTILTEAEWPDGIDIDTSSSESMAYWWMDGKSAYTQITDLSNATLSNFYIAADGTAKFRTRTYDDAPVVEFSDTDALKSWKIRTPAPRDTIKNISRVFSRSRVAQNAIELWRLNDIPLILPGASVTIWAAFSYNSAAIPATTVTTPTATTDYTMNTAEDGSGTDLTAQFNIALTTFSTTAKMIITNNSASAGYITLLKLRGDGISANDYTFAENTDAASVAKYKDKLFEVKTDWLQDINTANDQAIVITNLLANPRRYPQFMTRGKPAKQFIIDLYDLATISFVSLNIGAEMRVGYIEHNIVSGTAGNIVDTLLYFEPNLASGSGTVWTFPATFTITF